MHRFQGREFDVVVFDMVEGGGRTGWVGQGQVSSTSRWQRDGARVFNVALTRARLKVYLIGSGNLIRKARPSTVLGAVNALSATGRIVTVKAATLLGPGGDSSGPEPEPLVEELAAILAQHVRVMNIDDEHTFYATLREYLEGAQESVWMWAAWTTKRLATVLPLLEAARNRGVRLCVFVRSDRDPLMADPLSQRMLRQLLDIVPNTVRYYKMHQKIVIIDERVTLPRGLFWAAVPEPSTAFDPPCCAALPASAPFSAVSDALKPALSGGRLAVVRFDAATSVGERGRIRRSRSMFPSVAAPDAASVSRQPGCRHPGRAWP